MHPQTAKAGRFGKLPGPVKVLISLAMIVVVIFTGPVAISTGFWLGMGWLIWLGISWALASFTLCLKGRQAGAQKKLQAPEPASRPAPSKPGAKPPASATAAPATPAAQARAAFRMPPKVPPKVPQVPGRTGEYAYEVDPGTGMIWGRTKAKPRPWMNEE